MSLKYEPSSEPLHISRFVANPLPSTGTHSPAFWSGEGRRPFLSHPPPLTHSLTHSPTHTQRRESCGVPPVARGLFSYVLLLSSLELSGTKSMGLKYESASEPLHISRFVATPLPSADTHVPAFWSGGGRRSFLSHSLSHTHSLTHTLSHTHSLSSTLSCSHTLDGRALERRAGFAAPPVARGLSPLPSTTAGSLGEF
jgi:hypothetical protein